jgi:hypothetical protein
LNKKAHLLKYIVLKYKVLIITLKTNKCYTIRTVLKCNRNIVTEEGKSIPLTHIYMIDHFQLMSIGVKIVLCVQISPLFYICFLSYVMLNATRKWLNKKQSKLLLKKFYKHKCIYGCSKVYLNTKMFIKDIEK